MGSLSPLLRHEPPAEDEDDDVDDDLEEARSRSIDPLSSPCEEEDAAAAEELPPPPPPPPPTTFNEFRIIFPTPPTTPAQGVKSEACHMSPEPSPARASALFSSFSSSLRMASFSSGPRYQEPDFTHCSR